MYRVVSCLTTEHDWRLVLLAAVVCFLASAVAVSLFHRAQVATGRARAVWLNSRCRRSRIRHLVYAFHCHVGIRSRSWRGIRRGADDRISADSNSRNRRRPFHRPLADRPKLAPVMGGAVVGAGVAAMHYTGMAALDVPARLAWSPGLVIASILLGIFWASLALYIACHPAFKGRSFIATILLAIRDRFDAFHRYGCRAAAARSSTCHRCSILFSDRTVACRCRDRRNHPRHVFGGCARRKAHKGSSKRAKGVAAYCPGQYVPGTLHVRWQRPHHSFQSSLYRPDWLASRGPDRPHSGGRREDTKFCRQCRGVCR